MINARVNRIKRHIKWLQQCESIDMRYLAKDISKILEASQHVLQEEQRVKAALNEEQEETKKAREQKQIRGIIIDLVSREFEVNVADLMTHSRKRKYVNPRVAIWHFMKLYTTYTLNAIGEYFDGRDHSTVVSGVQTCKDMIQTDEEYRMRINRLDMLIENELINEHS